MTDIIAGHIEFAASHAVVWGTPDQIFDIGIIAVVGGVIGALIMTFLSPIIADMAMNFSTNANMRT